MVEAAIDCLSLSGVNTFDFRLCECVCVCVFACVLGLVHNMTLGQHYIEAEIGFESIPINVKAKKKRDLLYKKC